MGSVYDESPLKSSRLAKILAQFWIPKIWGHCLGPFTKMSIENIHHLQAYPIKEGAKHKQLALQLQGLFAALKPWSEGGVDVTNLPYSYSVSPIKSPSIVTDLIQQKIYHVMNKKINVLLSDSDKTYLFKNIGFASRPSTIPGLLNGGFLSFIIGRKFHLPAYATPVAYSGSPYSLPFLLKLTSLADRVMGYGAGPTAWDMARQFSSGLTQVTWEMLSNISHYPVSLIRMIK